MHVQFLQGEVQVYREYVVFMFLRCSSSLMCCIEDIGDKPTFFSWNVAFGVILRGHPFRNELYLDKYPKSPG